MPTKATLLRNTAATGWNRATTILYQFIQVPILITAFGIEDYGRWLIIFSFSAWIKLSNMGFGSVASNEISMLVAGGKIDEAKISYSTAAYLVAIISILGILLTISVVPFIPWEKLLQVGEHRHEEMTHAIIFLTVSVFLSFNNEFFYGRFRAARKVHQGILLASFQPWLTLLFIILALQITKRFDFIALACLVAYIIFFIADMILSRHALPTIRFSKRCVDKQKYKLLFQKGIAFQAMPLGNVLLSQGYLLIVQIFLGPAQVAIFGTARTLVRAINQLFEMLNQISWPEFSLLFGEKNLYTVRRLHRAIVVFSLIASIVSLVGMLIFGKWFFELWTGNVISLTNLLLLLFLIPIPFHALWFSSSVVHMSSNQHEGLAIRYLIAAGISTIMCLLLTKYFGIEGAAIATLILHIILLPYVLKKSLEITEDTFIKFIKGMKYEILTIKYLFKFSKRTT